jgi:CRP-like cAMP-binding protein
MTSTDSLRAPDFSTARQRLVHLQASPLFENLPKSTLLPFALESTSRLGKGDILLEPTASIDHIFMLVDGSVGLYREGKRLEQIFAPHTFGVIGLLADSGNTDGSPGPPGTIRAEEELLVVELESDRFFKILEQSTGLQLHFLEVFARAALKQREGLPFDPAAPPEVSSGTWPSNGINFVQRLLRFKDVPPFTGVDLDAVAEICQGQNEVVYREGDHIWQEGARSDRWLHISAGRVRVESDAQNGVVGSEYSIGMFDTLAGGYRPYSCTAATDVFALEMIAEHFFEVLEDHFALARNMLRVLADIALAERWDLDSN